MSKSKDSRLGLLFLYSLSIFIFVMVILAFVLLTYSRAGAAPEIPLDGQEQLDSQTDQSPVTDSDMHSAFLLPSANTLPGEMWRVAQVDSRTSLEMKTKSPLVAGLLGGVLGYGSGQYYSKKWISGTAFLILDGLLTAVLVDALASDLEYEPQSENLLEAVGETFVVSTFLGYAKASAVGLAVGGLVATHVAQAIWGPLAADRYNEKMRLLGGGTGPYVAGSGRGIQVGFAYRF